MRFMLCGIRVHEVAPAATCKAEAMDAETLLRARILRGDITWHNKIDFIELADIYLTQAKVNKRSWRSDISHLNRLKKFFGKMQLSDIKPFHIENFKIETKNSVKVNGKPISNATVNRSLEVLSKMFTIACNNDWVNKHPFKGIDKLKENNVKDRFLSKDEEIRLMDACIGVHAYMKPIIVFALQTGARKDEILNLKWKNVNFDMKCVLLTETKNGKDRHIPMSTKLYSLLQDLQDAKGNNSYVFTNPDTGNRYYDLKRAFPSICKKANIENFRFHDLRHTAATRIVSVSRDLTSAQKILDHSDIKTTMRYVHPVTEDMKRAVECLAEF